MSHVDPAFGFYRHSIDDHDDYLADLTTIINGLDVVYTAGVEVNSHALTASVTALTSTTAADITGLATTFTLAAAATVLIKLFIPSVTLTVTDPGLFTAFIVSGTTLWDRATINPLTGTSGSLFVETRQALAAGSYTYKAQYLVAGTDASAVVNAANSAPNFYGPRISAVYAS